MKRLCCQVLRSWWSFAFSTLAGFVLWPLHGLGQGDSAWETFPQGRFRAAQVQATGRVGFTVLGPGQTGLQFTNVLSDETAASNQILLNGSGVALGDVNGDGWTDVYLCGLEGRINFFAISAAGVSRM